MIIDNQKIELGENKIIQIPISKLASGTDLYLSIHVFRSNKKGPCVLFAGGLHGDEINGVEIIRRLLRTKTLDRLKGTLIAVPIVNVFGFNSKSRYLPDRRDLNRCFPGSPSGSLAARLAHLLMDQIVRFPIIKF